MPGEKPARRYVVAAFLRQRVRDMVDREKSVRAFARRAGMSHANVLAILNGDNQITSAELIEKICEAARIDSESLTREAYAFATEHPESLAAEGAPSERVERVATETTGALPGWREAEERARARWPWIPDAAWTGARGVSGFRFPEGHEITPEFVKRMAELYAETGTVRAQSEEEARREAAEDEGLDPDPRPKR